MFKIKTLNAISDVIHEELSAEQYVISPEEPVPEGILVRSAVMHDAPLNPELLGIARAGAGVNNIPLDKCTKQGLPYSIPRRERQCRGGTRAGRARAGQPQRCRGHPLGGYAQRTGERAEAR